MKSALVKNTAAFCLCKSILHKLALIGFPRLWERAGLFPGFVGNFVGSVRFCWGLNGHGYQLPKVGISWELDGDLVMYAWGGMAQKWELSGNLPVGFGNLLGS